MDYIYGKLNFEVQKVEYEGASTSTAQTTVDNEARTVSVDVLNANMNIIPITWLDLKTLRDGSLLKPGQQYRITNYTTTTAQPDTQSAGHVFDIIVTADSVNKLNEQARAIQHDGDTYFANSKLEAWQVWYSLDNDTNRFAWADEDGTGVIYRLIDEFNNDCPYDFKNIQFTKASVWYYTFADDLVGNSYSNKIGVYISSNKATLNAITFGTNCHANTFGSNCYSITFGNSCRSNTFGTSCYSNTFGNSCYSNTFGDNCYNNTFGNYFFSNTFGNACQSITFGNNCSYNTFGDYCFSNTFGNYCNYNTFDTNCYYNTFGNNCSFNTFGNDCISNTFGTHCRFNTFGNNCSYLQISDISATQKKNIHVENGTQGASSANRLDLYDTAILDKNYQVTFKKDISGRILMTWQDDKLITHGKYKTNNLDPTWKTIEQLVDGGTW